MCSSDLPGTLGIHDQAEPIPSRSSQVVKPIDTVVQDLERELEAVESKTASEIAKLAVDVAGLADPTPISDAIGAALSLKDGDLLGAGLSIISMIPYFGDAAGKPAKAAKSSKTLSVLKAKSQKIREAISERLAKIKGKKAKLDGPETRPDYFDGKEYPNSPYIDKTRHPAEMMKEIEEKIAKEMQEAFEKANERIARANSEILKLHEEYIKTGKWRYDGMDDWSFPDDGLKALREKYIKELGQ